MNMLPQVLIALPQVEARRTITVTLTRDGEQTANIKVAKLFTSALDLLAVFAVTDQVSQTFLATAIDGDRLLLATDSVSPRRAAARWPPINADLTLAVDLNDGAGGASGEPASLAARVRVDGADAVREVLAVERQIDGAWRVAGNLSTADGVLDLRVTGGSVYTVAVDEWGIPFQPSLSVAVGATVRPPLMQGWLYRITEAGTLPATEPAWWPAEGDNASRLLGTARAIAVRYYQPLAHGPLPVELL